MRTMEYKLFRKYIIIREKYRFYMYVQYNYVDRHINCRSRNIVFSSGWNMATYQ